MLGQGMKCLTDSRFGGGRLCRCRQCCRPCGVACQADDALGSLPLISKSYRSSIELTYSSSCTRLDSSRITRRGTREQNLARE